ncbi:MAG: hypothetical protein JO352_32570 [Chloroflexi bacterium]|nr:hypothetical protein [Chloroflexota bacterium]MBV9596261.1 hypothetical protein [Chloroflexota bacterium]
MSQPRNLARPRGRQWRDADTDIAVGDDQVDEPAVGEERTTIRWPAEQLATIRRAAAEYGLPYQIYIRDAAFRRALEDLQTVTRTIE